MPSSLVPEKYRADIAKATEILKNAGCTEGYLFGSIAKNRAHSSSDLDLAVRGIHPSLFFKVYGILAMNVATPVDLIDLDDESSFSKRLIERGEWMRVI